MVRDSYRITVAALTFLGGCFFAPCLSTVHAASFPADAFSGTTRTVTLPNGTYADPVTVPPGGTLVGQSQSETILSGGVLLREGAQLKNLTVTAAGIKIEADADARIEDVVVRGTTENGIETVGLGLLEMRRTKVVESQKKGVYVRWGKRIAFSELAVENNHEEGVDARSRVSGFIRDSVFAGNGESGLEIIVGDSRLEIVDNRIMRNASSGASFQFYASSPAPGAILVSRNAFADNQKNGIDCSWPNAGHAAEDYFARSLAIGADNTFTGNGKRGVNKACTDETGGDVADTTAGMVRGAHVESPLSVSDKERLRSEIEASVGERLAVAEQATDALHRQSDEARSRLEGLPWLWLRVVGIRKSDLEHLRTLRAKHDQLQTEFKDFMQQTIDPAKQERVTRRYHDLEQLGRDQDDAINHLKGLGFLAWLR